MLLTKLTADEIVRAFAVTGLLPRRYTYAGCALTAVAAVRGAKKPATTAARWVDASPFAQGIAEGWDNSVSAFPMESEYSRGFEVGTAAREALHPGLGFPQ